MGKMSSERVMAGNDDLTKVVAGVGGCILELLSTCGYSVDFSHMGIDRDGNCVFFVAPASAFPRAVSKYPQTLESAARMEEHLRRRVKVVADQGKPGCIVFIVQLQVRSKLATEPVRVGFQIEGG